MKYDRISFCRDVMNPKLALAAGNYNSEYRAPEYVIEKQGDIVVLTHTGTGVTVHLPWSATTGAAPSKGEPAHLSAVPGKGKR